MMELSQDENKWLKYRWEFMRRDPCYRESYTTATEDIPREVNEETITRAEGAVEICHICGEYGLSKMIHPDLSFEELDEKDKESLALGGLGVCDEIDLGSRVLLEYNELVIYINFATINSLDALKKRINTLVDIKYKSYLEEHQRKFTELLVRIGKSETGKGHKKTLKLKDYKRILRIGDLREKGWKIDKIADHVFPRDASFESAIRKVRQHLKTYDKLVDGVYMRMTYP